MLVSVCVCRGWGGDGVGVRFNCVKGREELKCEEAGLCVGVFSSIMECVFYYKCLLSCM